MARYAHRLIVARVLAVGDAPIVNYLAWVIVLICPLGGLLVALNAHVLRRMAPLGSSPKVRAIVRDRVLGVPFAYSVNTFLTEDLPALVMLVAKVPTVSIVGASSGSAYRLPRDLAGLGLSRIAVCPLPLVVHTAQPASDKLLLAPFN